ncbi:MAG: DUF2892 domain-containing protein [Roseovarius sp.]
MTANIGKRDLVVRVVLGMALIFAPMMNLPAIWSSATLAYCSMGAGLILVVTAMFRVCPVYRLLGISTRKV